jgi:hypothetical protein
MTTSHRYWEDELQVLEAEVETLVSILQTAEGIGREEARRQCLPSSTFWHRIPFACANKTTLKKKIVTVFVDSVLIVIRDVLILDGRRWLDFAWYALKLLRSTLQ